MKWYNAANLSITTIAQLFFHNYMTTFLPHFDRGSVPRFPRHKQVSVLANPNFSKALIASLAVALGNLDISYFKSSNQTSGSSG